MTKDEYIDRIRSDIARGSWAACSASSDDLIINMVLDKEYRYRYLQKNFKDNFTGNSYGYLMHNSSNQYELDDDVGTSSFGYICEAQGKF